MSKLSRATQRSNAIFKLLTDTEQGCFIMEILFGDEFYPGHSVFKAESYSETSHELMVEAREILADALRELADSLDNDPPEQPTD